MRRRRHLAKAALTDTAHGAPPTAWDPHGPWNHSPGASSSGVCRPLGSAVFMMRVPAWAPRAPTTAVTRDGHLQGAGCPGQPWDEALSETAALWKFGEGVPLSLSAVGTQKSNAGNTEPASMRKPLTSRHAATLESERRLLDARTAVASEPLQ